MKSLSDRIVSLVQNVELKVSVHCYEELANDGLSVKEVVMGLADNDTNIFEDYPE